MSLGTLAPAAGRRRYRGLGVRISRMKCWTAHKNGPTRISYLLYTRGKHARLDVDAREFDTPAGRTAIAHKLRKLRNK